MQAMKTHCKCVDPAYVWAEEGPDSPHEYRVHCGTCNTYIKWGNLDELARRRKAREKITVIPLEDQVPSSPPATLDEFLDE